MSEPIKCADCGKPTHGKAGARRAWQLEDGRTVCNKCCAADTKRFVDEIIRESRHSTGKDTACR